MNTPEPPLVWLARYTASERTGGPIPRTDGSHYRESATLENINQQSQLDGTGRFVARVDV